MSIRLDQVAFTTTHESYAKYDRKIDSLELTADILPNGFTQNYPTSGPMVLPYTRAGTRADVYIDGNGYRVLASSGSRMAGRAYNYKSSETFSVIVNYTVSGIELTFTIFNGSGASITLNPQTIDVIAVFYDAPLSAI